MININDEFWMCWYFKMLLKNNRNKNSVAMILRQLNFLRIESLTLIGDVRFFD